MFKTSVLFTHNYNSAAHVVVNQGGTSSGKTYAVLQVLFCLAAQHQKQVITIVGQDIPNLKAGALRDALAIYYDTPVLLSIVKSYNKTDRVFEFYNGSVIEFKSYDSAQDAKSGKRDYLFINEANGISHNVYTELALRTRNKVFIDYNPNAEFWVHDHLIGRDDVELIISDHRHNPFLPDAIRQKVESLRDVDVELWKVYARGMTGKILGLILNNWFLVDAIPNDAARVAMGLDFGFTNDQTGLIDVYRQNGELWLDELVYETGLTNTDIAKRLDELGVSRRTEIVADSAEPKSIEELRRLGWHVVKAQKGPDSVKNSIDILQRFKLNITRRSVNLRRELSSYKWRVDQSGRSLNEPVDRFNHLIDPLRYVALNKLKIGTFKAPKYSKI
ncbi:terminase [Mucilaginibacter hurinus]|uniref:Terminase n=1 Tax=Mucilaginibacter hurinus TaxID=2201324 RepID=A0A367GLN2_9SPHI|nr:terminase large subunit [Mucilaginibacter hurinus]RCH53935.1 terminase [Mucilaginibacter hurinus]